MSQNKTSVREAPVFGCIYGPGKVGKTTDMLYSMPRALFIAKPAALKSSINVVGFEPSSGQVFDAKTLTEASGVIGKLNKDFDGVVIDDLSLLVQQSIMAYEKAKKDGYKLWGAIREDLLILQQAARQSGKHVLINAHIQAPTTKNGIYVRGGPELPGSMAEDFPKQCDFVLRTQTDPQRQGPWKIVYRCSGDTDTEYTTGDRNGVIRDLAPMNIGELLREAGYHFRRAPGLEWMEQYVEKVAELAYAIPPTDIMAPKALAQQVVEHLKTKTDNPLHIRWVLRDGFDRAMVRRMRTDVLSSYI